jgi:hypothetical protein
MMGWIVFQSRVEPDSYSGVYLKKVITSLENIVTELSPEAKEIKGYRLGKL